MQEGETGMADLFTLFGTIAINADSANRTIDNTSGRVGGLAKQFNSVGTSAVSLVKKVKSFAITAGIAKAITSLTKASIGAYANYEQLVGGVETLFGAGGLSLEEYAASVGKSVEKVEAEYNSLMNAQSAVFANAQQAYKTAGLSANEYMETATSFAASLVSSLKGNTEEAARLTDMAVTDMADNANKMGTNISSIQNAYQGFAKQNYTMLDNLKLGYGGTKKEMQRLLKDAQKLSGQKYNIKNLDDVIEAIHVIQTEMGITGTTAMEASETISGSWNAAKSAWDNLLIGLSDGNADIDVLFDNLTSSAGNVVKNVAKVIPPLAKNIVRTVGNLLQTAGQKISDGWENTVYPAIKDKLKAKFGIELPEWRTIKETITTKWAEVKEAFSNGDFTQMFEILMPDWNTIVEAIGTGWDSIVWPVIQGFFKVMFGVEMPDWNTITTAITDGWNNNIWPSIQNFFKSTFSVELPEWGTVWQNIQTWWENVQGAFNNYFSAVFSIFTEDSDGQCVAERILEWWQKVLDAIGNFFSVTFGIDIPTVDEIAEKLETLWTDIKSRWNQIKRSLGIAIEEDDGSGDPSKFNGMSWEDYHNAIENGDGNWAQGKVTLTISDNSEGEMQSEIDGYNLEGEALVGADSASGQEIQSYLNKLNLTASVKLQVDDSALSAYDGTHKSGLDRVPFDGYRALLHKDEMVLTASQAAVYRRGQTTFDSTASRMRKTSASSDQPINVTLNITGASSNPYEIADEVRNALELLRWQG